MAGYQGQGRDVMLMHAILACSLSVIDIHHLLEDKERKEERKKKKGKRKENSSPMFEAIPIIIVALRGPPFE